MQVNHEIRRGSNVIAKSVVSASQPVKIIIVIIANAAGTVPTLG